MQKVIREIYSLLEVMMKLSYEWEELPHEDQAKLALAYPFHKSFDELIFDTIFWLEVLTSKTDQ
jgi:hypothetical protein